VRERIAVRKVRALIDDRFADPLTLAELAAHVGTSPFHLCRVFAHAIGMGPHAYQTQVRLNRAKQLLRAKLPIAEVAARAGFADQSHLHRHFRRHVGVTPGRYCR
jgi:AraC-like DNA-binding protein